MTDFLAGTSPQTVHLAGFLRPIAVRLGAALCALRERWAEHSTSRLDFETWKDVGFRSLDGEAPCERRPASSR